MVRKIGAESAAQSAGIRKTNRTSETGATNSINPKVMAAWANWKTQFIQEINGKYLVKDPGKSQAFSEGTSYGMMMGLYLSISINDQETFNKMLDGIETYAKNSNGLYAWKMDLRGRKIESKSATDADIMIAYCLVLADEKIKSGEWKLKNYDYGSKAKDLLQNIWSKEIIDKGGKKIIKPSDDGWPLWGDGRFVFNPSYFMPHQLRMISEFSKAKNLRQDWNKVIDDGYELMNGILGRSKSLKHKGQNPIPDWVLCKVENGEYQIENYEVTPDAEYDAVRVPIYLGMASVYDNDAKAKTFCKSFLNKAGVHNFWEAKIGGYNNELALAVYLSAVKGAEGDGGRYNGFIGQLNTTFHNNYYGYTPADAKDYYKQSLILLSLIAAQAHLNK